MGASNFAKLLSAFAGELDRLDDDIQTVLNNAVPGLSGVLLPDWERELALPEDCIADPDSLTATQRRNAAHAKYTANYAGLSEQFFIDLAASYGSTITISLGGGVGTPFRTGGPSSPDVTRVGPTTPADDPDRRLWSVTRLHVWIVNIASSDSNVDLLRCVFGKLKPAHTVVQFNVY